MSSQFGHFKHWNKLISEIDTSLKKVLGWGRLYLVQFNATKANCQWSYVLVLKTLPYLPQPVLENLVSKYREKSNFVAIYRVRASWHRRSLTCSINRDGISLRLTTFYYIRRRFGRMWNTVLIFRQRHPSTSSFPGPYSTDSDLNFQLPRWPSSAAGDVASLCIFYRIYYGECFD